MQKERFSNNTKKNKHAQRKINFSEVILNQVKDPKKTRTMKYCHLHALGMMTQSLS
jgi:hypothetical protein